MLGNAVEISLIFPQILGPLVLGWAPNHFVLGAQIAPGKKRVSLWTLLQIDILVNNAGRSQRARWVDTDLEVDRQMLDLNVISVLSLTKLVLPHMLEKKQGHIVCMSSVAGKLRK